MDASREYLRVGDLNSKTVEKLKLEIKFLEDWLNDVLKSGGDLKLVKSLTVMIESRKRVLKALGR